MLNNLGIARVKVKDITKSLALREKQAIDPFNQGFDRKSNGKNINLHQVRLCFQVYEINNIKYFIDVNMNRETCIVFLKNHVCGKMSIS